MPIARPVLIALALLLPASAAANGLTTHAWISEQALSLLPEGELADLLRRPELRDMLINGTLFPDGGYAVGHSYGETGHWEPFRMAYQAWIRDTFEAPYTDGEAAEHVAFLMGLSSHGMADEIFDSRFMELSRQYDPGWNEEGASLDTASDVLFAAAVDGFDAPEQWIPADVIVPLMAQVGIEVDAATLVDGQSLTYVALGFTDWARTSDERLETFGAQFPWTAENIDSDTVAGAPRREAIIVARYWQAVWDRLNEGDFDDAVLHATPVHGAYSFPTDATTVESRLFVTLARGVSSDSLDAVRVEDISGQPVPTTSWLHYGNMTRALVIAPSEDWAIDQTFSIRLDEGLVDVDGNVAPGGWSSMFHTLPPPIDIPSEAECACHQGSSRGGPVGSVLLLIGLGLVRRRRGLDPANPRS